MVSCTALSQPSAKCKWGSWGVIRLTVCFEQYTKRLIRTRLGAVCKTTHNLSRVQIRRVRNDTWVEVSVANNKWAISLASNANPKVREVVEQFFSEFRRVREAVNVELVFARNDFLEDTLRVFLGLTRMNCNRLS